ncbi:MAG: hypothetical protein ACI89J_001928 [Hyphomicrobiaceae bacterium]|jgi:hypothetical protein
MTEVLMLQRLFSTALLPAAVTSDARMRKSWVKKYFWHA